MGSRIRSILGVTLVGVAFTGVAMSYSRSVSVSAVISAPLQRLSPPLDGRFTPSDYIAVGDIVEPGTTIGAFSATAQAQTALHEIETHRRRVEGVVEGALRRAKALGEAAQDARKAAETYRRLHIEKFALLSEQAAAAIAVRQAERDQVADELTRAENLSSGHISKARIATIRARLRGAEAEIDGARAALNLIVDERNALRRGVWVGDGEGMPWPVRFAIEAERAAMMASIESDASISELRAVTLQAEIEREAIESFTGVQLKALGRSVVVTLSSLDNVISGQTVAKLADCGRSFVLARFEPTAATRISRSDTIRVRFIGEAASVAAASWQILDPTTIASDALAAAPGGEGAAKYFRINLDDGALSASGRECAIGHSMEVTVAHERGAIGGLRETTLGKGALRIAGIVGDTFRGGVALFSSRSILATGFATGHGDATTADRSARFSLGNFATDLSQAPTAPDLASGGAR